MKNAWALFIRTGYLKVKAIECVYVPGSDTALGNEQPPNKADAIISKHKIPISPHEWTKIPNAKQTNKQLCPDFTVICVLSSEVPLNITYKEHLASLANSQTLVHKNHLDLLLKMEIAGPYFQRISLIGLPGGQKSEFLTFGNTKGFKPCGETLLEAMKLITAAE